MSEMHFGRNKVADWKYLSRNDLYVKGNKVADWQLVRNLVAFQCIQTLIETD